MKSFIVNQVSDWEKLKLLIKCLADDSGSLKDSVKRDQVRLLVLVAEVFQHQIVEYLSSVFSILLKKIEKESRPQVTQGVWTSSAPWPRPSSRSSSTASKTPGATRTTKRS